MVENKVVDRQQKGHLYEVSQLIPSEHLLPPTDLVSSPLPTAADNFTLSTFKQPQCFAKPKTLNSSSQRGDFLLKKSQNTILLSHTKTTVQETLTSDMYIICKDQLPPEDWMLGSQKQHPVQIPSAQQELDCNNKPPRTHVGCFWI
jgi:hypothetical protein